MFKNIPIRLRLTAMTVILLTICCIGLTFVLNFTAYRLADRLEAAIISDTAQDATQDTAQGAEQMIPSTEIIIDSPPSLEAIPTTPINIQEAKKGFSFESLIYMVTFITLGGLVTYYVSGKALQPLDILSEQIKNRTVNNLSESIELPTTNDEIADLTLSFNEMTNKLNDAFLMQKRFSANAAHELRTPLAVLKTKVDVFKKKTSHSDAEYNAIISVFENQTARLSNLVLNLLDMTNMSDDFEREIINLHFLLEDIVVELTPIADKKHIAINLDNTDITAFGNTDLLYRVFYNIIENAIKYNIENGSININVTTNNSNSIIQIADTGIGIPDDVKNSIFEPFYRIDKSRSRSNGIGGAGLGLSIVDNIIKKHGGTITITNNKNGGSCFTVTLTNM